MKLQNHDATLKSLQTQVGGTSASPLAATDTPAEADEPAKTSADHDDPHNTNKGLKKKKQDYQFKKFFDILKQVHTNLPLVETLQQMSNYAKFLKDMLGIGEEKPTTVMLQLADHSYAQPEGKIEDILIQVGYNQIAIALEDQSKTTFTCPYGTFAFRRMPFGLCNAPATFQRCMTVIFSELNEDCLEIFMDDFSTFGEDFDNLLKRDGSRPSQGRRISKLPPPTIVKGIQSFLAHAGFYRRFIEDFSKITKSLCSLLEQGMQFEFNEDCTKAFNLLKHKLVSAPIVEPPDWTLPLN
ncbi:hypothetical protein GQ457_02G027160 [Hibiscus cannabinus]